MMISKIKKKIQNCNFLCVGACHNDNILKLKNNFKLFRTNPVDSNINIGGVCSNIADNLSLFTKKIDFFTLPISYDLKKKINKKIKFHNISNIENDGFYTAIIDKKGKLLMGLASNYSYEKVYNIKNSIINHYIKSNTYLVLDLCFNKILTKKIINYYHKKKLNIMVAGTSLFKIHRIKNSLKMITALCLNEDEALILSNKKKVLESIDFILKKNPKISLVITRGSNPAIMVINKIKYKGNVPKIKIKNENGAGDSFAAMFFLCLAANFSPKIILSSSITLGCLKAMDFKYKNMVEFVKKFQLIKNKIKIKKYA